MVARPTAPHAGGGSEGAILNSMSQMRQTQGEMAAGTNAALQNIAMNQSTYQTLYRMKMNPSEKDVTDGWAELMINITAYAQLKPGDAEIKITYYVLVKNRVLEIVDESEHDKLCAAYYRKSGKELRKQHVMSIKNLEAAVKELIDQNAAETSIKVFLDLRISGTDSLADQMDDIKRHVGKFLPDEFELNGITANDKIARIVTTKRIRELIAPMFTIGNLTQDMDGMYKGIVRDILLPTLKKLTNFSWDEAVSEIKAYGKKNGTHEEKKLAGAANMANTTQKKKQPKKNTEKTTTIPKVRMTWDERQLLDPMDPSTLEKLKRKFETLKLTEAAWKQHCIK